MEHSFIVIGCEGEQLFSLNFLNSIFDSVVNFALFFRVGIFVITVIVGLTFLLNSDFLLFFVAFVVTSTIFQ